MNEKLYALLKLTDEDIRELRDLYFMCIVTMLVIAIVGLVWLYVLTL